MTADRAAGRDLLATQAEELRRLMPPIDAFGVGGSHGRGSADDVSDLDFFVVVPDDAFWPYVREFPALVRHPFPVISSGVGRFMSDYGYRVGFVLEGNRKVEYYFNAPATMTSLPLSARIRVLEDRSGWLSALLAEAQASFDADRRAHVVAGVHDCLLDVHDLRKHAARGDLLPMIWRLNSLRRFVLALDRVRDGDVYAPSSGASRLGARGGDGLVARVDATVPTIDPASIAEAYRALRELMLESWDHFAPTGVPTPAQRQAERELSADVLRALES